MPARGTHVEDFQGVAGRVQHCEENDGEQDHDERLDVEEYQREEEIMTAVFDEQQRQELLRELDARQTLVESQGRRRGIGN